MQNTKNITVYAANCRENPTNCLYPHRIEITDEASAAKAFSKPWCVVRRGRIDLIIMEEGELLKLAEFVKRLCERGIDNIC